ncbi:vWA domain-containing protein, partial [Candidatus Venteria ishoeyi]|uniref:hypothetical protein n=1 Tax=Candidatus Venteria ishoeyi TaxID=1899563 RepID=UPI0015AC680D
MMLPIIGEIYFKNPELIWLIIPLVFLLFFIIQRNFLKINKAIYKRKIARVGRVFLLMSRSIVILLLLIALAGPYTIYEEQSEGNPRIALLVDNSTSMKLFDINFVNEMKSQLSKEVPTTIREIGKGNKTTIAEGIFANMDSGNIVLVTDGQNYKGKNIEDVLLLAKSKNISLNMISIEPEKSDASVSIEGPSKVVEDVENEYIIKINKVLLKEVFVKLTIDDEVILEETSSEEIIEIKRSFEKGKHTIKVEIGEDNILQNNIYYK